MFGSDAARSATGAEEAACLFLAALIYPTLSMDRIAPATRWYPCDPGLQTSASIQPPIVAELQRSLTKIPVIDARREAIDEPNDSGVTMLDDTIRQAYRPGATFGALTIM
jgi:hypothetical protein